MQKKNSVLAVLMISFTLFYVVDVAHAAGFDQYQIDFQKSVGEWGNQCIIYVRNETGISWNCCHGNAQNCYSQAKDCGYQTGDTPVIGSIMVMGAWSDSSVGHDAIVISIDWNNPFRVKVRDSNWGLDEKVQEHWIDTGSNSYGWFKYIYPKSNGSGKGYRIISEDQTSIAWWPSDVPCNKASIWAYNQTCSAENSHPGICQTAYDELRNIDPWKYSGSNWRTIFFGDIDDFQNFCY